MKRFYSLGLFLLIFSILIVGCKGTDQNQDNQTRIEKNSDKKNGLEMMIDLNKRQFNLDEQIIATIKIVNHENVEKILTVPNQGIQGIAHVATQHQGENWQGSFHPESLDKILNEKGVLDNTSIFTIGPNQTLEQDFIWDQKVMDQIGLFRENNELLAPSGDYKLFAFLMIGKMVLEKGESKEEMIARYQKNPLEELNVNLNFKIAGERDLVSLQKAKEIVLANDEAKQWFVSRSNDQLVKKENGEWFLKDIDGRWTKIGKEQVEQFKDLEPHFIGGERQGNDLLLYYESVYGGSPHKMNAKINTLNKNVISIDFTE